MSLAFKCGLVAIVAAILGFTIGYLSQPPEVRLNEPGYTFGYATTSALLPPLVGLAGLLYKSDRFIGFATTTFTVLGLVFYSSFMAALSASSLPLVQTESQ